MPSAAVQAARALVKRSRRGLYAGKTVLSGNNVSEDGGNRTRRIWKPNVQRKALYSEALDRMVRLNVTTSAIRTIDKYGGLDAYLLGTTDEKLASDVGSELKQQIRAALALQKQQRKNGVQSATASFAAGGLEASSRNVQLDESTDRSAAEQGADTDSDSAAVVPKRVRPDLVEEIVQKTRWDGSMTQAIKKINRRPLWTYTP